MKYLIGLDGGGSKTKCAIVDSNGKLVYETNGKASNFLILGVDMVCKSLFELIDKSLNEAKINYNDIEAVLLGTTGAGRKENAETLEKAFLSYLNKKGKKLNNFIVESDAIIALEGAFPDSSGSILICGTGSIMYGKDDSGNYYRMGGFGRKIGDEGGGYYIGQKALNVLSKELDGRINSSQFGNILMNALNVNSDDELISKIYNENYDIASVAQIVLDCANNKLPQAIHIINDATDQVILHIKAMRKKMNAEELKVCFIGSLISNKNYYSDLLRNRISTELPYVNISLPANPPEMGAILLAKKRLRKEK